MKEEHKKQRKKVRGDGNWRRKNCTTISDQRKPDALLFPSSQLQPSLDYSDVWRVEGLGALYFGTLWPRATPSHFNDACFKIGGVMVVVGEGLIIIIINYDAVIQFSLSGKRLFPPPPTGGRNTRSSIIPEFCSRSPDVFLFTHKKRFYPSGRKKSSTSARIDAERKSNLRKTTKQRRVDLREDGEQLREMESERCAPPGALFAVETTAVISPSRSAEAIIIERQRALCVHVVHEKHKHTRLKSQQ